MDTVFNPGAGILWEHMTVGTLKISLGTHDNWDLGRNSQRIINNHIMVVSNLDRVSGRVDDDDVD